MINRPLHSSKEHLSHADCLEVKYVSTTTTTTTTSLVYPFVKLLTVDLFTTAA